MYGTHCFLCFYWFLRTEVYTGLEGFKVHSVFPYHHSTISRIFSHYSDCYLSATHPFAISLIFESSTNIAKVLPTLSDSFPFAQRFPNLLVAHFSDSSIHFSHLHYYFISHLFYILCLFAWNFKLRESSHAVTKTTTTYREFCIIFRLWKTVTLSAPTPACRPNRRQSFGLPPTRESPLLPRTPFRWFLFTFRLRSQLVAIILIHFSFAF